MRSQEKYIASSSDYFVYTPGITAQKTFFYPLCTGHFLYEAGYHQHRNSYDSFLLMYIQSGELSVHQQEHTRQVTSGHFVLLDCYQPHGYRTSTGWESIWLHFDGPVARAYYELIVSHLGNIFSMQDSYSVISIMEQIYHTFSSGKAIREAFISKQITDILTSMLLHIPLNSGSSYRCHSIEETISYINENFSKNLTVGDLAERAMMSQYHFIRVFKKETGFTPHEYLVNTRISAAKYMLKTTQRSVKDICYDTGFSCESVFCAAFKKSVGVTPAEYRLVSDPNT